MTAQAKLARVEMCKRFLQMDKKDPEFKHMTAWSGL